MANLNKTPIINVLRQNGGTLYTMPSAAEDIGLNLNSRTNSVSLSHYALLNIPIANTNENINRENIKENLFNVTFIPGQFDEFNNNNSNYNDAISESNGASWQIAASLQNYMMNFETRLLNEDDYNYQDLDTVSERVFWKWLKETGAIQWEIINNSTGEGYITSSKNDSSYYFVEGDNLTTEYNNVVKCFGTIDAGNNLANEFGFFNETYINIPSSYGAGKVFFESINSNNYKLGRTYTIDSNEYLEGRTATDNDSIIYTINKPFTDILGSDNGSLSNESQNTEMLVDGSLRTWYGGYSDTAYKAYFTQEAYSPLDSSITNTIEYIKEDETVAKFRRSNLDGIEIVKDINEISKILKNSNLVSEENKSLIKINSYDDINIDKDHIYNTESEFQFNAILLYYSIYNQDDANRKALATNLFGVLFLNSPISNITQTGFSLDFNIPTLTKKQSTENGFGTGFSFRINLKTLSVYDNSNSIINDGTTSNSIVSRDFNNVIAILNNAIENMNINVETTKAIQEQYSKIINFYANQGIKIDDLSTKLNGYLHGNRSSVLNTSILNTPIIRSGNNLVNTSIQFQIPISYDSFSNNIEYSDSILTIDASGVNIENLDSSIIYNENLLTKVIKYNGDSAYIDVSVENEVNSLLDKILNSEYLNVLYTEYNKDYVKLSEDSNDYIPATQRNKELIIDPDSPILNNGDLSFLMSNHIENLYDEQNSKYETAYINNVKLVPYLLAIIQKLNSKLNDISINIENNINESFNNIEENIDNNQNNITTLQNTISSLESTIDNQASTILSLESLIYGITLGNTDEEIKAQYYDINNLLENTKKDITYNNIHIDTSISGIYGTSADGSKIAIWKEEILDQGGDITGYNINYGYVNDAPIGNFVLYYIDNDENISLGELLGESPKMYGAKLNGIISLINN